MEDDSAIEMYVGGLVLDPNTQAPVVVLKDETGELHLPIWIGVAEATSIATAIKELEMARPLTHDLMLDIISEAGMRVERIMITALKDSTYYSELILARGERAVIFDARPSDAIAVALRASAPIFVAEEVLKKAQITFGGKSSGMEHGGGEHGSSEQGVDEHSGQEVDGANLPDEDQGSGEDLPATNQSQSDLEEEESFVEPKDFKSIDKEKWEEILAELDVDDFKYKT